MTKVEPGVDRFERFDDWAGSPREAGDQEDERAPTDADRNDRTFSPVVMI
jgi:hypothetical protein